MVGRKQLDARKDYWLLCSGGPCQVLDSIEKMSVTDKSGS